MPGRSQTADQQSESIRQYLAQNLIGTTVPSRSQAVQAVRAQGYVRRADFPALYRAVVASNGWTARRAERGTSTGAADIARRSRRTGFVANAARIIGGALGGRNRYFGVEIEFIGSAARLVAELRARGVNAEQQRYNHTDQNVWKVVPDASLSYGGAELVSPKLRGDAGFAELKKVCEALRAAGCRVDSSCGLHVHHDGFDLTVPAVVSLLRNYSRNRDHINGLLAASRHQSRWANPWTEYAIDHVARQTSMQAACSVDRYRDVNIAAYLGHGTVEFRQHQGTINFAKMSTWIRFTQAMVEAGVRGIEFRATSLDGVLYHLTSDGLGDERITAAERATMQRRAESLREQATRRQTQVRSRYGYYN